MSVPTGIEIEECVLIGNGCKKSTRRDKKILSDELQHDIIPLTKCTYMKLNIKV